MPKALPRSIAIALVALLSTLGAQGASRGRTDSAGPAGLPGFLEQYAATRGFTLGLPRNVQVTPNAEAVLFLRGGPRSFVQDLYTFDLATGRERVLLTA